MRHSLCAQDDNEAAFLSVTRTSCAPHDSVRRYERATMTISGKTTLAEIKAAARGVTGGAGFILRDRTVQSVQQSVRVEGHHVTVEQVRQSAERVLKSYSPGNGW